MTEIQDLREKPSPVPATVRPGYQVHPSKPCHCGKGTMQPTAFNDCGEISMFLMCDWCSDSEDAPIEWPFVEDRAHGEDFEKLGFIYEY